MTRLDLVGGVIGFTLTLMVFSYLIRDNFLYKLAVHLFIGVAAGYAAIVAINTVILPRLILPLFRGSQDEQLLALVPLVLGWMLLSKISPRLAPIGNVPLAFLVGVAAAVAIGGAVTGTILPQVNASINLLDLQAGQGLDANLGLRLVNGGIILLGTVSALAYFHFGERSVGNSRFQGLQGWLDGVRQIGQVFIAITFGFLFAGVYSAALTALIERLSFLVDLVKTLYSSLLPPV
jgi:hypothetical protein